MSRKPLLLARQSGHKTDAAAIDHAFDLFTAQGKRMARNGVAISDQAENKAEFSREAKGQLDKTMPIYKALGIV